MNTIATLDLRGLPPPQPLVTILRLLRTLPAGSSVDVRLERDPLMLYPELAQIGWQAQTVHVEPGDVQLRLTGPP